MARSFYTEEHLSFLREKYKTVRAIPLTALFNEEFGENKTVTAIRSVLRKHKIKGHSPHNRVPFGTERITRDGYIEVKLPGINPHTEFDGVWKAKHYVLWEEKNGKVKDGHILRFIDGDKRNCVLENLMMISRAEHLQLTRVGYDKAPEELKPVVVNVAKMDVKIRELTK